MEEIETNAKKRKKESKANRVDKVLSGIKKSPFSSFDKEKNMAFGWPGIPPRWNSSVKCGVGTALNPSSKVWFTMGNGILNEVYYPQVDQACTRDMGLIVTDGKSFFSEEKRHTSHKVAYLSEGIPAYKLINTCLDKNYVIEKEIITDPSVDSLLQRVNFIPMKKQVGNYHLYVLLTSHLGNIGSGNTAWCGDYKGIPMLFAERDGLAVAFACSVPWKKTSVGFVGFSDGWQDLKENNVMTWSFKRAENGNVALTGEIDIDHPHNNQFTLVLGFGRNWAEAGQRARSSLLSGFERARQRYIDEWQQWHESLNNFSTFKKRIKNLYKISVSVLRTHESKRHPGGLIASLSIPWGFAKGDDDKGGYHLVWPRDLTHTAGGMLACNAREDARRVVSYLRITQEAEGFWSQNMWLDGIPYWSAIQMDQAACPLLLLDLAWWNKALKEEEVKEMWPMVRKAAGYILRKGPATDQDRWEENAGYTPYSIAIQISALLIAAEHAEQNNEPNLAALMRQTADAWNESIEKWIYVEKNSLSKKAGVKGYYFRVAPRQMFNPQDPRDGEMVPIKNKPTGKHMVPTKKMISPDALALVRYGLRDANDPKIKNTVKVIDRCLKVETPCGPCWHRYNNDGYGEHADGSPYDGLGIGRAWPLLTGERGHYEVAAGNYKKAKKMLEAMTEFSNEGGMIPEQIWDAEDIPERRLFLGRPAGSAMPLVWAHAEYIKLCRSLKEKKVFDMPRQTKKRYLEDKIRSKVSVWSFHNKSGKIRKGTDLRIDMLAPGVVRWTMDDWKTIKDTPATDAKIGLYYVMLPASHLPAGAEIKFTFYWHLMNKWENVDFTAKIEE